MIMAMAYLTSDIKQEGMKRRFLVLGCDQRRNPSGSQYTEALKPRQVNK